MQFTKKDDYKFGDLSKEILRRLQSGQYNSDDVWLFLKIVAMIGINLQPVVPFLPAKVLMEMLEVSVAQSLADKVTKTITTEVDRRMKGFLVGDSE